MIVWFFTIPVWVLMIVLLIGAAAWEKFGSGIVFLINIVLMGFCFLAIPCFFGGVWLLFRKISGKDDDITWGELLGGLVGCGFFGLLGISVIGKQLFG